jgi:hypothetical protein
MHPGGQNLVLPVIVNWLAQPNSGPTTWWGHITILRHHTQFIKKDMILDLA